MSSESVSTATPSSRLKKILPVFAAILALLLGAVAIYAILVGPSKEPYRDALTQYRNFYNANVAFTNSGAGLNAGAATDEAFAKNVETVRSAMKSVEVENEALGKYDVLQTGEGRELYDSFNSKLADYIEYNDGVITSIEVLRPTLFVCSQQMNSVSQDADGAASLRKCAEDLEDAKTVPNEPYQKMAERFSHAYATAADATEQIAKLDDPEKADKKKYAELISQQEDAIADLTAASTTFSRDLQQSRAKVDITDAAMKLDNYLTARSSIFWI